MYICERNDDCRTRTVYAISARNVVILVTEIHQFMFKYVI